MSNPNPTPRPTRSRYNSPFGPVPPVSALELPKTNADNDRPKTMLDKWVEPSLAPPRPSFVEAGFERLGAVAGMAPLGTLPTAKVIKNSTAMDVASRGAMGKKPTTSVSTPGESARATATPELTTVPSRPASSSAKAEESTPAPVPIPVPTSSPVAEAQVVFVPPAAAAQLPLSIPPQAPASAPTSVTTPTFAPTHMTYSTPQTPQEQTSPGPRFRSVPQPSVAQQKMGQYVFALQPSNPPPMQRPVAPVPQQQFIHQPPRFIIPSGDIYMDRTFTDKIVEAAVQEAIDDRRWPTAYALRTLYDEFRMNDRMVRLIDAIYSENADENQIKEFQSVMRHRKKEGKKDNAAEYMFKVDGDDATPAPRALSSTACNAYASAYSTPSGRSNSGVRTMSDAQARKSSIALSSMSASPHKEHEHVSKKHKGNHFTSSNLEMNGNASAGNGAKVKTPSKHHQSHTHQNGTSNSVGHGRSNSMSSSSSLSSVDEQVLDGGEDTGLRDSSRIPQDDTAGGASGRGVAANTQAHHRSTPYANAKNPASAETHAGLGARNQHAPISTPTTKGPKTYTFSTVTTSSSANNPSHAANTSHRPKSSANNSMAPAALLPSATISSTPTKEPSLAVFKTKKDLNKASARPFVDENDSTGRMKRDARRVTEKNTSTAESFERGRGRRHNSIPLLPEPPLDSASDGGESVAPVAEKKRSLKLRFNPSNKKSTRQIAINYDSDSLSSPTNLAFPPEPPGSRSVSRAGTPNTLNRPTRKGKTGTGLRVKTSPMKKKGGGPLAGMPRASGERNSPVGNGAPQDDNDEYCSACGGNGDLVCCDGCTRSFHFKCVDPPMNEDALPDSWYCNVCDSKAYPPIVDDDGIFGLLSAQLERKNPSAFHLPKDIREYFENVKTGAEGEYEEPAPPKAAKNRAGYDEAPDYFKLKDSKGKTILCHRCHGAASSPDRAIIPCTYCGLYWHMDCLDNPLAKEPTPSRPWRCPAHVDDLLAILPVNLGPAHRRRKIKGASAIKPVIPRGLKNNGDIEIENDPTDDEEELGFFEQKEYGHIYKLPELGIKLDFISQVRQKTGGGFAPPRLISHKPASPARTREAFSQRSIQEKQAALNLASLCAPAPVFGDVTQLIQALLAQASPEVVTLIAQGDAENLHQGSLGIGERTSLLAMQARIARLLAGGASPQPEQQAEQVATPASTTAEKTKDEGIPVIDEDTEMLL